MNKKSLKTATPVAGETVIKENEIVILNTDKNEQPKKMALNLDSTLEIVTQLHRKVKHRNNLISYSEKLDALVIKDREVHEFEGNSWSDATLTIRDSDRNIFELKNANIIGFIINAMTLKFREKIEEIEAEIILP